MLEDEQYVLNALRVIAGRIDAARAAHDWNVVDEARALVQHEIGRWN